MGSGMLPSNMRDQILCKICHQRTPVNAENLYFMRCVSRPVIFQCRYAHIGCKFQSVCEGIIHHERTCTLNLSRLLPPRGPMMAKLKKLYTIEKTILTPHRNMQKKSMFNMPEMSIRVHLEVHREEQYLKLVASVVDSEREGDEFAVQLTISNKRTGTSSIPSISLGLTNNDLDLQNPRKVVMIQNDTGKYCDEHNEFLIRIKISKINYD